MSDHRMQRVLDAEYETPNFIDGNFVPGSGGETFANICPLNGRKIGVVHEASKHDVDCAVKAAHAALRGKWGRISKADRFNLLYEVANGIDRRFEDFVEAEVADTGKPRLLVRQLDIPRSAANFKAFADIAKNASTESFHMDTPDGAGALNYALRRPKGVIAVISPWNYPMLLMTWKVAPALACGNTVVVKPSEETPSTTTLLGEVMKSVGVPKGVYNVVHGHGPQATGEFLTQHPDVDAITFTGETRTGEAIMQAAAIGTRDVSLEMGGKNASIVFADADFDAAVEGTLRSAFANCGQVCLGTERVYVERPVYEKFVAELARKARSLKLGGGGDMDTDMGPLISEQHRKKVMSYYAKAVEEGATIVAGGGIPDLGELNGGWWVEPTIWTDLSEDSSVMTEEVFGPCCHISPFDTEGTVIELANASPYGLAASVWTADNSRAHRVAHQLDVGIVWVNSWFLRDIRTAFGGSKSSGVGREGGLHSLDFYSELSNICMKI